VPVQRKSETVYRGVCPEPNCGYDTSAQDNQYDAMAQLKDHMGAHRHKGTPKLQKKTETIYRPVCDKCGWTGYVEDEKSDAEYQLDEHMGTHEGNK
jgi:hypothetical protein